ncbi:MAG TPA: hypothetical protein DEQ03_19270 [Marinilabiliales bacterium]|nr:hypothetical protein [Marinilabiliales bacterium]
MAKVAIPVEKDCLSTNFGVCTHYALLTIEHAKVVDTLLVQPNFSSIEKFASWFKGLEVTDVVTYKINPEIIHSFIKNKINVFVGTTQMAPELLIQDYINGKLQSNTSALE